MSLHKTIHESEVLLDLEVGDLGRVVDAVLDRFEERGKLSPGQRESIHALSVPRDLGHGVGVLRINHEAPGQPRCALASLPEPVRALDGQQLRFLWVVVGPKDRFDPTDEELEAFGWMIIDRRFSGEAMGARTSSELLGVYERYLDFVETPPVSKETLPPELRPTGTFMGGLRADIERRASVYVSDFTDGLHPKTLASVFYLFFALLAPAVAFGGLSEVLTGGEIGAVETIVGTAAFGLAYSFLSGQPLTIIGSVGPVVVFTGILYSLAQQLEVPFLPTYAWVGMWSGLFLFLLAATDASNLIRYFTRFTDEIFAALMSLIFVVEAVKDIAGAFAGDVAHDTSLLSLILALGTFYFATQLSALRRSKLLVQWMREFFADFGPAISIVAMTGVAFALHAVELETLAVPEELGTTSGRDWFVNPLEAPVWVWGASIVPALLIATLLFFDQNITTRLVASPDHKLAKGSGYHLDLAVVGGTVAIGSLFGLPWMVAATVRSLNHVRSLATIETHGGDEVIVKVRETRLSGIIVHILIGTSLFLLPLLARVPMSVLFGLFLFMGFASMRSSQFFERALLWVTDPAMYPPTHYVRRVPRKIVHIYTAIQAACLAILWAVKVSPIGLLFPLFIAMLVPIRVFLNRFFDATHLAFLDAEEAPDEESNRELD